MKSLFGLIAVVWSFGLYSQEMSDTLLAQRVSMDTAYSIQYQNGISRFEIRPGDYVFNGNRSQIKADTSKSKYYSFDFRVDQYKPLKGEFFSIADWHLDPKVGRMNAENNIGYRSVVAINLMNKKVVVGLRPINDGEFEILMRVPIDTGWMHFEMEVNWSAEKSKGSICLSLQDEKKELKNIPTLYPDGKAVYYKLGIYRSAAYQDTSVVSFRNIKQDKQWLIPDFDSASKGEGKGYKVNGIDRGLQLDKYYEKVDSLERAAKQRKMEKRARQEMRQIEKAAIKNSGDTDKKPLEDIDTKDGATKRD